MSTAWPTVPLGEMLRHDQRYIDAPEPKAYPKLSVRLYGRGVVLDAPADGAALKMKRHQFAKAGQIILSEIWGKKGAIGFVPKEGEGALCTSHFFLFDVCDDKCDPRWLQAIFDANYLQQQLDSEAKGTTGYAAVRPSILLACEIPLPPLAEQQRIVARIETLTAHVTEARLLRHQAIEKVSALVPGVTANLFESLNNIPKRLLSDAADKRTGIAYRAEDFEEAGDVPVVRLKEIGTKSPIVYLRNPDEYPNVWLEPGDIVLAKTSFSTGAMCQWPGPAAVLNQNAVMLRAKPGVQQRYLFVWLGQQVSRYLADHLADPNFYPYIRETDLMRWEVPLPPLDEQLKIVAYLDGVQAHANNVARLQAETAAELDALMPAILDRAFKAEL